MAKQITDDEDKLKRQARRRLIGAVALTTAIVVVLPMVLDNEPKPVGQDIELRIPDKDKVGAFVPKIDLPAASAPAVGLPASAVVVPASAIASPPALQAAAITPPVAAAVPVIKSVSPAVKIAPIVPELKQAQPKNEIKPDPVLHATKPEPAKPAGTAHTEQGKPAPQTGFVVQIGAFSNAETAHRWQKNLQQQGFKAYTENMGNKVRVRTGPYSTREEANKVHHKLEAKGLHSNIVELE